MNTRRGHTKLIAVTVLVLCLGVNISFGSFTGVSIDEHSNKFSLKNLSELSKNYSLSYVRTGDFRYVGTRQVSRQRVGDSAVEVQSMMRVQRGNTTFVYPYKYKVQVPRFKAPAPPAFPMNTH